MPTYFPHVDGLRALAVVAVIIYHINPSLLHGGFVGVDVFFVISGFVVTASLANHKGESLTAFLGLFYARRLARIVPPLMAVLVSTTFAYVLLVPHAWLSSMTESVGQAAFWGFSNWILDNQSETYFAPRAEFNPYTHTWSLGVEEQYYLIAPLLLFGWVRWRKHALRRRLAVTVMTLLALASFFACMRIATHYGPQFVFYEITFRFWELAAGVLWFQWTAARGATSQVHALYWRIGEWLGFAMTLCTLLFANSQTFPWPWALVAVTGTLLLIGDPSAPDSSAVRWFFTRPQMIWIGLRSYSLYLWHWPIIVLFRWTVGLETGFMKFIALSLVTLLATASYQWIERPVRQSAKLKALPTGLRVTGFIAFIGLCWGSSMWLMNEQPHLGLGRPTQNTKEWYVTKRMEVSFQNTRQCKPRIAEHKFKGVEVTEYLPGDCAKRSSVQLFVLGDSHATAYMPMFDQLSAEEGQIVRVYHTPGCPYIDLIKPVGESRPPSCLRGVRAAMKEVLLLARKGDIVFLPSLRLPRIVDQWGSVSSDPQKNDHDVSNFSRSPNSLQSVTAAIHDAPQWFEPFQKAALHVMFELPKPIFRAPTFRCLDVFNRLNTDCKAGLSESKANEEAYRAPTVEAIRSLALQYPKIIIWDPLPLLCENEHCNALQGEHPLFFDADHVSAYGNVMLYPSFKGAIMLAQSPS